MRRQWAALAAGALAVSAAGRAAEPRSFGASNPFFAPSPLPFQAPPFDEIKNEDYRPAIEAGMARQLEEIRAITAQHAAPTFANTFIALEKSGQLLQRASAAFNAVTSANINPLLQEAKTALAPKLAAHHDAIYLNPKLFARVAAVYRQRRSQAPDAESLRLIEITYAEFVHSGAKLAAADKARLRTLNEEASTLSDTFTTRLLAANKEAAYTTADAAALAGLSEAQLAAAAEAARERHLAGYLLALQNTSQQPALAALKVRATRQALFENSWTRAERGDANDTRATLARLAQLRAQRAQLLGFPNHAAWKLEDQMAKTPQAVEAFLATLAPPASARAAREGKDIQALLEASQGGATLEPWDWDYYSEQVRRSKFALSDEEVKPYFELNNVLENGVFYAAHELYGLGFKERKDLPVYQPEVRVFEVADADGSPLGLFYCDYFKRDNKNGGAWMSVFVEQSTLLGTRPVVYNVANLPKPAAGEPALISFEDVTTLFHEFGHALHGMLSHAEYPSLSGTTVARDFVEFPSQFNEHWALHPKIFGNYAKHYKTGAPMPQELIEKIRRAANFNQGYKTTELVAAAQLDMQWHTLAASAPLEDPDEFERAALSRTGLFIRAVPPRYRSSYFSHIWGGGYSAGYYAYLWTQMLADDAYQWFDEHGGLSRENGARLRAMILSRGNTLDLAAMYAAWRGRAPNAEAMMKYRGLEPEAPQ